MEFVWTYLLPFLAILTALVFVHELGHYSVARWAGVRVEVFSIGFGPELFGWTAASGTRWKFSAIPLGGYVKMFGDNDPASAGQADDSGWTNDQRKVAFHHQSLRHRALIIAAGPAANFAFAIVLLAGLFMTAGQPQAPAVIDQVVPGSAAERAGLRVGDRMLAIDGASIAQFEDLRRIVVESPGRTLAARVARDGREIDLIVVPESAEVTDTFGNTRRIGRLGVRSEQTAVVRLGPVAAVSQAVVSSYVLVEQTLSALGEIITGVRTADELGGPLRIAQMSGAVAQTGLVQTIWFMAVLSVNLGLINLFPIPVLDGGHLLFHAVEATLGRPMSEKLMEIANVIGLALVIGLMVFVTWNDLVQLKVLDFFGRFLG